MVTDTIVEDTRWGDVEFEALAERAAVAALTHLSIDLASHEIAVLACNDARIASLNTEFRSKDKPTNVLSWPSEDLSPEVAGELPPPPNMEELGDIAISFDTCLREANEGGKSLNDHVTHLVIHGVLHLLGYDHIRDPDATLMEETERRILGTLGIDDPY